MKFLSILLGSMLPFFLWAQKPLVQEPALARINQICDKVVQQFVDGKRTEAIDMIWENSNFIGRTELDTLVQQLNQKYPASAIAQSNLRQVHLVAEKDIPGFNRERIYMLRMENKYLFIQIGMYKGKDAWGFSSFSIVDELPLILLKELKVALPDKDKKETDQHCDRFMQLFAEGKVHEAFQEITKSAKRGYEKMAEVEAETQSIVDEYFPSFGKILGYKLIKEFKANDYFTIRYYSFSMETMYLLFKFTLYKDNGGWEINGFQFDTGLPSHLFTVK